MHTYDIDALYASIAKQFWTERERALATGGQNNIRAKGDGPEKAVRDWIAGVVGTKYRVTEGHVVTADGRKSKQIDVIIVWDAASGTLYGSRPGEPELVRAECVAAVGEVKSSWHDQDEVLRSYSRLVSEIADLQEGLLVENRARFGEIKNDTSMAELAHPITGRAWINKSYNFVIALGFGKCKLINLANDMMTEGIAPMDASALILDEQVGGAICMPYRAKRDGQNVTGMQCEVYREADEAEVMNSWTTLQETVTSPAVAAGRLLHLFLAAIQAVIISPSCVLTQEAKPHVDSLSYISTDDVAGLAEQISNKLQKLRTNFAGKEYAEAVSMFKGQLELSNLLLEAIRRDLGRAISTD